MLLTFGGKPQSAAEAVRIAFLTGDHKVAVSYRAAAANLLIVGLQHPDREVKRTAISALAEIKDPRAVQPLINLLNDWGYSSDAAAALGEIGDSRAIEPLLKVLAEKGASSTDFLEAIGKFNDMRCFKALIQHLGCDRCVGEALINFGSISIEPLIDALKNSEYAGARKQAAEVLAEISGSRGVEPLLAALNKDEDLYVRYAALRALERMGWKPDSPEQRELVVVIGAMVSDKYDEAIAEGAAVVEILVWRLKHEEQSGRISTNLVRALGEIGDPRAVTPLVTLLESFREREDVPPYDAPEVVAALQQILKRRIEDIPSEALRALICLADMKVKERVISPDGEWICNQIRTLDFSQARQLVHQELLRRGVMTQI